MRFGGAINTVRAPAAARLAPGTSRSHRNDGGEDREVPLPAEGGHASQSWLQPDNAPARPIGARWVRGSDRRQIAGTAPEAALLATCGA
jgi:hypothetical protein